MRKSGKIVSDGLGGPPGVGGEATYWSETGEAGGGIREEPGLSFPRVPKDISQHLSTPRPALDNYLHSLK